MVIIIAVIVILVAGGIGAFYFASSSSKKSPGIQGDTMILATTTSAISSHQSTISTSSLKSSSSSAVEGASGITTYSGTFNFTVPDGPSGVRTTSNGSLQIYNTTQFGSGSFTFFISAGNESGSGTGHGTLTATTTGFCSGSTSFQYSFIIPDATTLLGNLTVFFANPNPGNFSIQLSCTGDMNGVSTATNNPSPFLPTYPNEITVASVPAAINQQQTGGFKYSFNIVQTG